MPNVINTSINVCNIPSIRPTRWYRRKIQRRAIRLKRERRYILNKISTARRLKKEGRPNEDEEGGRYVCDANGGYWEKLTIDARWRIIHLLDGVVY